MSELPIASIVTLGCKLNLADSSSLSDSLKRSGYRVINTFSEADAYVINTCSVTHVAAKKSRRLIRSARRLSPDALVTVTGCYPATAHSEVLDTLGADFITGTGEDAHSELISFLRENRPTRKVPEPQKNAFRQTRSFIKAQEGCNDVCAFCIIPRTRGRERSRLELRVAEDVAYAATTNNSKEVVITGTQLGAWGRDLDPLRSPHQLIAAILEHSDIPRIRFSSLQPQDITPELLGLWHDPRLMPHFHLALQAGTDATLNRMRRRYNTDDFRDAVKRIKAVFPEVAITTDVIAGFPGETDADFTETLEFCEEMGFSRIHAFPYSPREKTAAYQMTDHVPHSIRKDRMQRLLAMGRKLNESFRENSRGQVRSVLWEDLHTVEGKSFWRGLSDTYIPIYISVGDSKVSLRNRITPVLLQDLFKDGLLAMSLDNKLISKDELKRERSYIGD
jgi:threonylcarbamoyladenosine tRNA methylthiotransferase MtaB